MADKITIGIITYHHYYNYGTMLQALALQKAVNQLGYKSKIIDFKLDNKFSKAELVKIRTKRLFVYIRDFQKYRKLYFAKKDFQKRNSAFEQFYKSNLLVTKQKYVSCEELSKNPPQFDGYLVGSDQTWNPNVGKNPEAFFLSFVTTDSKKGCYAPSVGVNGLSNIQAKRMKHLLSGFKYLSCREDQGAKLLETIMKRNVEVVLDPTLLISPKQWEKIGDTSILPSIPYILQYFLGDVLECREFVQKLSKKTGLNVITLPHSYLDVNAEHAVYCSPAGFISLIQNAQYVCTDSFHGCAFSINFSKNVFAFHKRKNTDSNSDNSRITDIFNRLNIPERLIDDYELPSKLDIDYNIFDKNLSKFKTKSWQYLSKILAEMVKDDKD